ncbi:MAG TPA: STAS domain-containing protein [Solirubrobacteraceae bacterium]|jgi:anti-sigma B factor antagonist|nr:STAS domain-containing protein [Solirubrobacteraceae bacterium]
MADIEKDDEAQAAIGRGSDASGAPLLTVSGELDMSNARELEAAIDAVAGERPARLVFDVRDLRFIDSAGLAVLLGAAARAGQVVLREPSPAVSRVIEITGLSTLLTIEQ